VFLGERIGRSAIWGSLAGMVGVVIIVAGKFGETELSEDTMLGIGSILISAVFYAYNLILQRKQALVAGPREIAFFQNLALLAMLAIAAPWLAIILPVENVTDVAIATALNLTGLVILTWAFARAEAQYLIPMEYTGFVWAIVVGWVFFDESVGLTTVVGAVLIIAGCLIVALTKPKLSEPTEPAAV
jgi:S-adenosylmethionine uptake transporter